MAKPVRFLMVLYPLVAHLGLWLHRSDLAVAYLFFLLLLNVTASSKNNKLMFAFLLSVAFGVSFVFKLAAVLIYLPPTLIPMILFFVFFHSLKNTPIITQLALKIEGKLSPGKQRYTKKVTQVWLAVFAFMAVESIVLALTAPIHVWSWATHVGNYVLIATVFVVEFVYRCGKFETQGFKEFLKALAKVGYAND